MENRISKTSIVLVSGFVVMLYLSIGFPLFNKYFHGFGAVLFGWALLFKNIKLLNTRISLAVLSLIIVTLITIPFSPDPFGFFGEHITSTLMLVFSLGAAIGVAFEIGRWPGFILMRVCLVFSVLILIGSFLEVNTGFRSVSDQFRHTVYSNRFIYEDESRDILEHGSLRPALFTQEPSHVARFFSTCVICIYMLSKSRYKLILTAALTLLAVYVFRSPTLMIIFGVLFVYICEIKTPNIPDVRKVILVKFLTILLVICVSWLLFYIIPLLEIGRVQSALDHSDRSIVYRFTGPYKIAMTVLYEMPPFGSGIGGKELISEIYYDIYLSFPSISQALLDYTPNQGWNNAFFEWVIYYGPLGIVLSFLSILWLIGSLSYYKVFGMAVLFVVFNSDAGFVTFRPWCYSLIIISVCNLAKRQRDADCFAGGLYSGRIADAPSGGECASVSVLMRGEVK